ncbi:MULTISPECIES: cupin domain-containing protein [unclassified Streptomyces]|uniref:cupin domain-containing protein n=1 Tax=unclassified Streptomyces TaxID=2593676 RepID=UPI0013A6EE27|nr:MULTISPECIES: cupin domain-containing protein [unclassified Streptomyces]
METYSFEDFVGDRDVFLAEHFDKKPLLRKGALAGRLDGLPSVRQLDDVLALETTPPSYLRVTKGGKGVPSGAYTRTVARGAALAEAVNPEKVYELFRSGSTVTWNSLHHVLPSARRLLAPFTDTFACEGEVVLFVTPARNDGFSPHHDSIDVYVVQVDGTKTWRVWATPEVRRGDEGSYTPEELGEPVIEVTLAPGDVLYVPHGTPHAAAAKSELSLHLSVGVEPRRWRDLLKDTVAAVVEDEAFHAFPYLADGEDGTAAAGLGRQIELLRDRLAHLEPVSEAKRLARVGRERSGGGRTREFARLHAVDALTTDSLVRRSDAPVEIGDSDGTKTGIRVGGRRLAVPDAVARSLRDLDGGRPVATSEFFPGVDPARSLSAARGLARIGVLEAAEHAVFPVPRENGPPPGQPGNPSSPSSPTNPSVPHTATHTDDQGK